MPADRAVVKVNYRPVFDESLRTIEVELETESPYQLGEAGQAVDVDVLEAEDLRVIAAVQQNGEDSNALNLLFFKGRHRLVR